MKFAIKHARASLRDLATQHPILLALITIFSCTPLYISHPWFAHMNLLMYMQFFYIVILQTYITRNQKLSILYTLASIGISTWLYFVHETFHEVQGIRLAVENISYLWLYTMIALYFTSTGKHYIGEIINRLKRIFITCIASTLYNVVIIISLWFFYIIINEPFDFTHLIFKILASINAFICMTMVCTYKEDPAGPPEPSSFFTIVFGVILPKASIITGVLATIYLLLILLGFRLDTRFLYTYYPYVTLFYLFYLASFRSSESNRTQRILCILFITLTTICLALIGKRLINDPVLWLNTIYVGAFNLIFLIYNVYSLVKRLTPSVHTTVMALALGAVLFMPVVGYTTYRDLATYTKVAGQWQVRLPIVETFNSYGLTYRTSYEYPYIEDTENTEDNKDTEKTPATTPANTKQLESIHFEAKELPKAISVTGYNNYIPNIYLQVTDTNIVEHQRPSAKFNDISFQLINDGLDLEVSMPNGVTEVHHLYDTFRMVGDSKTIDPVVIDGTGYRLFIASYVVSEFSLRSVIFHVLYI